MIQIEIESVGLFTLDTNDMLHPQMAAKIWDRASESQREQLPTATAATYQRGQCVDPGYECTRLDDWREKWRQFARA